MYRTPSERGACCVTNAKSLDSVRVCIAKVGDTHKCEYIYMHMRTYTHIHTYMHACMHACIHRHTLSCSCQIYIHIHEHVVNNPDISIQAYIAITIYACMRACTYARIKLEVSVSACKSGVCARDCARVRARACVWVCTCVFVWVCARVGVCIYTTPCSGPLVAPHPLQNIVLQGFDVQQMVHAQSGSCFRAWGTFCAGEYCRIPSHSRTTRLLQNSIPKISH